MGGEPLNLLASPQWTWLATVLADVWKTTPFIALILLAGLQTIPQDLYEAFRLEGGLTGQALRRITIPLLLPYILLSLLFRLAQAFGVFDLIQVLTGRSSWQHRKALPCTPISMRCAFSTSGTAPP